MTEEWRKVYGWPEYEVSNTGKIRNGKGEIRGTTNDEGYTTVGLNDNGTIIRVQLHRLIARTFIGEIPEGYEVHHKDGHRDHANADNLEITRRSAHKKITATTQPRGEQHYKARLTEKDVLAIREEYARGNTTTLKLAAQYNVSYQHISAIVRYKTWRHI